MDGSKKLAVIWIFVVFAGAIAAAIAAILCLRSFNGSPNEEPSGALDKKIELHAVTSDDISIKLPDDRSSFMLAIAPDAKDKYDVYLDVDVPYFSFVEDIYIETEAEAVDGSNYVPRFLPIFQMESRKNGFSRIRFAIPNKYFIAKINLKLKLLLNIAIIFIKKKTCY